MDKILTITEVSRVIKQNIEGNPELTSIWVAGEISNITYHSSGHIYFTLKDKGAVLQAAFFKFANRSMKFKLEEGMSIIAFGSITIYEKRGSYQMIVNSVMLEGIGELQKKIDQLKKKLSEEGIFDNARKKRIPFLPKRIGVVTSPTGAAFRDILKVALRRFPTIEMLLAPAKVQGDDAAETIVKGIKELNKAKWNVDVIIAGRGGGSFEDLMPFNEEIVVRAFANSKVPIISAVGHQIDHPLSDDAADKAAPTPSAAAEIAVPEKSDLEELIASYQSKSLYMLTQKIKQANDLIENILSRRIFKNPAEMIYMKEITLDEIKNRMIFSLKDVVSSLKHRYALVPDIDKLINNINKEKINKFTNLLQSIDQLSPLKIIERGYSVVKNENEQVVKSVTKVKTGEMLKIYLKDGRVDCSVNSINKGASLGKKD